MAALLVAALTGVIFGALAVAQRWGLTRSPDVEAAAVISCALGFVVALVVTALAGDADELVSADIWPYLVGGLLAPGAGQITFIYAVGAIGAARSSTLIAASPLLAAIPAFVILDEPFHVALPVGAVLIVTGAVLLSGERRMPAGFHRIGFAYALASAAVIAARDNFVRAFARHDHVAGLAAGTASLFAAALFLLAYLYVVRGRGAPGALAVAFRPFAPSGFLLGLAYCANLEALTRGRVTIVSPFYGTEALWALVFAYLVLGRTERIGARVLTAAALMVTGAALIGVFR